MLRYIYADDLHRFPKLRDSMFRDRADQFHTRLGWEVSVDDNGFERDEYDDLNPLYVIWQGQDGLHDGSMRFLPTTGRTMTNEHFVHLSGGGEIRSPFIWECTRFCLSRRAESRVAAALMVACGDLFQGFALEHILGVFDARMERIYRLTGAQPGVLGSAGDGKSRIAVGLWSYSAADAPRVFDRANLTPDLSAAWFRHSFDRSLPAEQIPQSETLAA